MLTIPALALPFSRTQGLTLPELLWAVAIMSILLVAGVPSMLSFFAKYEAETSFRSLRHALVFARSEAVIRGVNVSLCPKSESDPEACSSDGDEAAWKSGWLVFVDRSDDSADKPDESNGDQILKIYDPMRDDLQLTLDPEDLSSVTFSSRGTSRNLTVEFCQQDGSIDRFSSKIVVNAGRIRMEDISC